MNIDKIKQELKLRCGKTLYFKYNGSRNQTEEFYGVINVLYNYVFTINVQNSNNILKCFSYFDVISNTLEIFEK